MAINRAGARVLLVEDEEITQVLHNAVLSGAGFETDIVTTVAELRNYIGRVKFDVVVMDLRLPDGNALEIVSEIRRNTSAGIIVVTSSRDRHDRWDGLERGADEYLEKPVHPRELLARVNNLVGRLQETRTEVAGDMVHRFEGWTVDLVARKVWFHKGGDVYLTEGEFRLLESLIRNLGKPVHRDRLLTLLSDDEEVTARAVDKAVYRVRIKLHAVLGSAAPLIETVRGFGYLLTATRL